MPATAKPSDECECDYNTDNGVIRLVVQLLKGGQARKAQGRIDPQPGNTPLIQADKVRDLYYFLNSQKWVNSLLSFIDEYCIVFDSEEENKFEYTTIHNVRVQ